MRVGINGMGRIGRLALRAALGGVTRDGSDRRASDRLDIAHVNELKGGAETTAHLLEFDSIHGRWREQFGHDDQRAIFVGNRRIGFSAESSPRGVAWGDLGCEIVLECTGKFLRRPQLEDYFARGVRRVIVAAPVKDPDVLNVVVGVNDNLYDPGRHRLLTAASCTTNCLAPVVKVLHELVGIEHGMMTTIHSYTNDQPSLDQMHKDLYRARAAALSMIPTSTGAAKAVGLVLPELKGKLDGVSVRVPTPNVSLVDLKFVAKRPTTVQEVNDAIKAAAAAGPLKGILEVVHDKLVSMDFNHNPASSSFALDQTKVMDGSFVSVMTWYDNEWGFSNRMADTAVAMGKLI